MPKQIDVFRLNQRRKYHFEKVKKYFLIFIIRKTNCNAACKPNILRDEEI